LEALFGTSDGKLDHGGGLGEVRLQYLRWNIIAYLFRAQLIVVTLVGDKSAELHGEQASLGSLNQWKPPVLEVDVVNTLEELIDGDFNQSVVVLGILVLESSISGMSTSLGISVTLLKSKSLDGVLLLVWITMLAKSWKKGLKLKRAYRHPCHDASR
jgi:hypothetical protein